MIAELLLVRHGKTRGNIEGRYIGRTDESLDPAGMAKLIAPAWFVPDQIFISPMKRCRETAEVLFPGNDYLTVPEFTEIDFGRFEYHTYQELSGRADYQAWIDSGGVLPFPDGESQDLYRRRVLKGFGLMCRQIKKCRTSESSDEDDPIIRVAAVVHGGTIMAILSEFAVPEKDYFSWHVENGCGYLVRFRLGHPGKNNEEDPDVPLPESIFVEKPIRLTKD